MKALIVYVLAFAVAFAGTTGLVIFLNNSYENIFAFNFEPVKVEEEPAEEYPVSLDEYTKKVISEIKGELFDTLSKLNEKVIIDTVYKEVVKDEKLIDSLQKIERAKNISERNFVQKEKELESLKNSIKTEKDEHYRQWISSTVKLYESMDSKKAAKIITNYSDNVARNIIYSMKKKKAAEILSNLNSEQIVKLTQAQ